MANNLPHKAELEAEYKKLGDWIKIVYARIGALHDELDKANRNLEAMKSLHEIMRRMMRTGAKLEEGPPKRIHRN